MRHSSLFERYQELQGYVGWTELDARSIQSIAGRLEGAFHAIVVDFYEEIDRHPEARKVLSGGAAQVERLKTSLLGWLSDLFSGVYDADYVQRRWRVGLRHAEIGLATVFVCDPSQMPRVDPDVLCRLFAFTKAEATLAILLMGGKSVEEAAGALFVSIHTARTHLKRMLFKTDTGRQSELLRLLLTCSARIRLD